MMDRFVGSFVTTAALAGVGMAPCSGMAQAVIDLPAEDSPLAVSREVVYRIGEADAETWALFSEGLEVEFDGAGNLYVLDRQNDRVVVVGPDGKLVREIGRSGNGPGEFASPSGLAVFDDGTAVVSDIRNATFTVFAPHGEFVRSVRIPRVGGMLTLGDLHPDPRGGAVYSVAGGSRVSMTIEREGPGGGPPPRPEGIPIKRYGIGDGGGVETVHEAWQPPSSMGMTMGRGAGGRVGFGMSPTVGFKPQFHGMPTVDGGYAFVDSTTYRITLLRPDGEVSRVFRRPITPVPVSEEIREAEKERRIRALEADDAPVPQFRMEVNGRVIEPSREEIVAQQREQIEGMTFWDEIPVVRRLAVDRRGQIWVERSRVDPTARGPIDLISFSGRYLGTVTDESFRIPDAFGPEGLVAYLERDELEVPYIEVRRLTVGGG